MKNFLTFLVITALMTFFAIFILYIAERMCRFSRRTVNTD